MRQPAANAVSPDETRQRIIDAAAEVFAEIGYERSTIRQICQVAKVNVAAVNYHFGDKVELYKAVFRRSMEMAGMQEMRTAIKSIPKAEDRFRHFVTFMCRSIIWQEQDRPLWHARMMAQELAHPSPALQSIVEEGMRPNYEVLLGIVGELIQRPAKHSQTRYCTHSVIGQVQHFRIAYPVIRQLWPDFELTTKRLEELTEHLVQFSLAGFASIKQRNAGAKRQKERKL